YAQDITVKGKPLYIWLLREDGVVEQLTAIFLALAALFSLIAAFRVPETLRWSRTFLFLFSAFATFMALEEISWGQRAFKIESHEFFHEYSDQQEINLHNVLQQYAGAPLAAPATLRCRRRIFAGIDQRMRVRSAEGAGEQQEEGLDQPDHHRRGDEHARHADA
ncbi:MAG: hypothetical protein ACRECM_03065, partial [Methyloceanibacter sp.]